MVLKTIERIKQALPEVEHIVMFYNDGTVYQTTFEQFEESVNIPKVGEDLAIILSTFKNLYDLSNYKFKEYNQLLFDTEDTDVLIIKIGENANLALFFRKTVVKGELQIDSIKKYITKIGKLIDIGRIDLVEREIRLNERELKKLIDEMEEKLQKQMELNILLGASSDDVKDIEKIQKEIDELTADIKKSEMDRDLRAEEETKIEEKISSEEIMIDLVKKELKLKRENVKEIDKRIKDKVEKKTLLEGEDERDENRIFELTKEIEDLELQRDSSQLNVAEKQDELKNLKLKFEDDKIRLEEIIQEKVKKELSIQDLYKELEAKLEKEESLKETVDIQKDVDKLAEISQEIDNLKDHINQLKDKSDEKNKEMEDLK
ncbi:MAG: hypothetical protein HeimAB125_10920, partial [Candidatus Heimdallarchaeota archaeon AB_125]